MVVNPSIDIFTTSDLDKIIHTHSKYAITIYMPTHMTGKVTREDHIKFKDLVHETEKRMMQYGVDAKITHKMLRPAKEFIQNVRFWDFQAHGLVFFISDTFFQFYRLPITVEQQIIIDPQFYVTPLLPLIIDNQNYYILAISENYTKLYKGNEFSIEEIHVPDMPSSMSDALWYKQFQRDQLEGESGKIGAKERNAVPYWMDKHKKYVGEYFQQVNDSLKHILNHDNYPLILATDKGLIHLYKNANNYVNLIDETIEGNPEHYGIENLQKKAFSILQRKMEKLKKQRVEDYKNLIGSKRFVSDINTIMRAADEGIVEALFIEKNKHVWGRYDKEKRKVKTDKLDTPQNDDLLNLALIETITKKGRAYILSHDQMPTGKNAAAVLRYNYVPPR